MSIPGSQPAVLPVSRPDSPPPAYMNGEKDEDREDALMAPVPNHSTLTVADLQRRQAELDTRAAQLDLREKYQEQQEAWRAEHGYGNLDGELEVMVFGLNPVCA